ncbi:MAG: Fic family protein [Gemmatimonadaceae bacterium]
MKIPLTPPPYSIVLNEIMAEPGGPALFDRLAFGFPGGTVDGKYRHWDILRHLEPPNGLTAEQWWLALKLSRIAMYQRLPILAKEGAPFVYGLPDVAQRMLHQIDRDASGTIRAAQQVTSPQTRDTYLVTSLVEEAITSSQLEGASTTRDVAKEMIKRGRAPRDRSERMILNNYQALQFIRQLKDEPLTPSIVFELQRSLTEGTLDESDAAGRFRRADEHIVVSNDIDGSVLHDPPPEGELQTRMEAMCAFANATDAHGPFVHPVVRSILLHFWLAYDHPFVDGNGRTARALFYWSMAQRGYWLAEFLSISRILKDAPSRYSRAFLYTETDDNDATYFILFQLRTIIRAIEELHEYLARKAQEMEETARMIRRSQAIREQLNYRQLALLNHALKHRGAEYTFESHRASHNVSYGTARTDLLDLAKHNLLVAQKVGRTYTFLVPGDLKKRLSHISAQDLLAS